MSQGKSFVLREALLDDCHDLVAMMATFYAEADYTLNHQRAHGAFTHLLQNSVLGKVWIIAESGEDVGYIVLTFSFSMEYGGLSAFVDDFYIRLSHRGRGLGHRTLETVKAWAQQAGVHAIHLEVGRDNGPGHAVYRRAGFTDNDRQLLTVQLSDPTHVV